MAYVPLYKDLSISLPSYDNASATVHYVEAGSPDLPTVLLLHGFPSSSNQYRDLIPMLSDSYHVLAPDLPGFGNTIVPASFNYTFDNLASVISGWLAALSIASYAMYIFDYGAPVGHRLALENPNHVKAIFTQNGNSYVEGFGHPFWDPIMKLWKANTAENREVLRENVLTLAGTKYQYIEGTPDKDLQLIDPTAYELDYLTNVAGKENQEHQLDLFYYYRTNVDLYPKVHEYFRKTQVPLMAVWGKNDPAFIPPGAEAYKRDLPNAKVKFVDSGHFALETKRWEIARYLKEFLKEVDFKGGKKE